MSFERNLITDIVEFNPKRTVKKGTIAPFIDMAALPTSSRDIEDVIDKEFKSGGAKFANGDTLFARITPCLENGKTAKVSGLPKKMNGFGSTEFIVMAAKEPEYDENFIYYLARLPEFRSYAKARMEGTSGRQRVPWQSLAEFKYPFPDKENRKLVGNVLRSMDDKITLNNKTNQTLEEMAQAIFKSWFVDFDPVKAKMNGEQPEGMDAATASLFPEKLVESELGLIPEGWEVTKLSKVIDLLNGFAFKSPDYVKEGTFVLRTKNFDSSNSVERLADDVYLSDGFLESHKKYLCEAYDYHVVMVAASIGKTAMIYPHQLPALRNQNMWCFRPKDEGLRFYTKYMVDGLVKLNMGLASGSARAFFKKGDFNSYEFALPSSELLIKFNDVVGNLIKQKGSLLNQNLQLATMRDTLLPKLLSGEIELAETTI